MSIRIAKRFLILRSYEAGDWDNRITDNRVTIMLGPGKAFGSGEHETTHSCLEELKDIPVFPGSKVLDLGCGTGILSIAAAKMGAQSVIALDPDPEAIKATAANIKLNKVEKIVHPIQGELGMVKGDRFDLIMANLYGDILVTLVKDIPILLKPEGYMLLSGIQFEYIYELKTGFIRAGCKLLKSRFLEEYSTMVFKKEPRSAKSL